MPAPYYVTNDGVSSRWTGLGRPLTAAEFDENIWKLHDRIDAMTATAAVGVTGAHATGTNLYLELSDGSEIGPVPLPVSKWNSRGAYMTGTAYAVNDYFLINGVGYIVDVTHVSATGAFDPGATDGGGRALYSAVITVPGNSLPVGGATGFNLRKKSSDNFDVDWAPPLPTGGATGDYLAKNSSTNFDAGWVAPPARLPATGPTGYFLGRNSAAADDFAWLPPLPTGGATGAALVKNTGADLDYSWATDIQRKPLLQTGMTGIGVASISPKIGDIFPVTITGDLTIGATGVLDGPVSFLFSTTGATSFGVTFGTGFYADGPVTTGATAGLIIAVEFKGVDGVLYETSRKGPF